MAERIDLEPAHLAVVSDILRAHLPASARVYVFGSRASAQAKPCSDLDLLIDAGRPLSLDERAVLAEAFSESDLPFKVDLADRHRVEDWFVQTVAPEHVELRLADAPDGRVAPASR